MTAILGLPLLTAVVLALMVIIPLVAYALSVIDGQRGDGSVTVWGRR